MMSGPKSSELRCVETLPLADRHEPLRRKLWEMRNLCTKVQVSCRYVRDIMRVSREYYAGIQGVSGGYRPGIGLRNFRFN